MACEMCGAPDAPYKCDVEGVMMRLCSKCSSFGKVIQQHRQDSAEPVIKQQAHKPVRRQSEPTLVQAIVDDFSSRIRKARESKGLKQKEFALMLAEKESVVHNLESGRMTPPIDLARKLERALKIRLVEQRKENLQSTEKHEAEGLTVADLIKQHKS